VTLKNIPLKKGLLWGQYIVKFLHTVRFEILTALIMKILWDVTLRGLVQIVTVHFGLREKDGNTVSA
jgi:hypothetical protein